MFITCHLHVDRCLTFLFMLGATLSSQVLLDSRSSGSVHVACISLLRGARAVVPSTIFAFPQGQSIGFFDVTLVSFVHMCIHRFGIRVGVNKNMKKAWLFQRRVQCRLLRREFVVHGVKFTQCRRRLVTRVHHSVCANNTAWRLAFSRRLLRRRPCEQFLTTDQNAALIQDQSTGGARVSFVHSCINQFDNQIV